MKIGKKMSAEDFRRATEYMVGDLIQIRPDGEPYAGRLGIVIGVSLYKVNNRKSTISYNVKLSDNEGISVQCYRLRLIRAAGSDEDIPENESQFLPLGALHYPEY